MYRYVIKRLLMLIPVVICVSLMIYVILDMAPGDVISMLGGDDLDEEGLAALKAQLGLDKPLLVRYFNYMKGLVQGDLGKSYVTKKDVFQSYMGALPATLTLAFTAVGISILISIPLGIFSATHQGTLTDNLCMLMSLIGISMPAFWLGLLLIIGFSLKLGWLPSGGFDGAKSLILPGITVAVQLIATLTRTTRSSMLDVVRQDYLRTARAKGVSERKVIRKHALKNALIPIITIIGTQLSTCLGGSVLTETVFAWPGVGRLILDAVQSRDTQMVTGLIIMKTITISIILLLVDLLYAVVDPRIKAQYSGGRRKKNVSKKEPAKAS